MTDPRRSVLSDGLLRALDRVTHDPRRTVLRPILSSLPKPV